MGLVIGPQPIVRLTALVTQTSASFQCKGPGFIGQGWIGGVSQMGVGDDSEGRVTF